MNVIELSNKYPAEINAVEYFEKIRWGKNPVCPYCNSANIGKRNLDFRFHCKDCQKSFSVTTNTNLHATRLPLKTWLYAFCLVSNAKKGISALQLQRDLKVDYKTAWKAYHKIRDLMSIENNDVMLSDITEIDTTLIGGKPRKCQAEKKGTPEEIPSLDKKINEFEKKGFDFKEGEYKKPCKVGNQKRGKGAAENKEIVGGIVQRNGNVIAEVMQHITFNELKALVNKHVVKKESVMLMDEDTAQKRLSKIIDTIAINHKKMYSYKGLNTNSIESFWALIKRQIIGQHHHVSPEYLQKYVSETVFKYNNRKNDDMFETLVKLSITEKR